MIKTHKPKKQGYEFKNILVLHEIASPLFWVNIEFSGSHKENTQRYMLGRETQMDACLVEHGFNIYWRC